MFNLIHYNYRPKVVLPKALQNNRFFIKGSASPLDSETLRKNPQRKQTITKQPSKREMLLNIVIEGKLGNYLRDLSFSKTKLEIS